MPDLISHTASAYIARNLFFRWKLLRSGFPLLLLGVFLPDILSRGVVFLGKEYYHSAQFFHIPFACFFQSLALSFLFVKEQRKLVFGALTAGWVLHQGFDLIQYSIDPLMYTIFWPLDDQTVSFHVFRTVHWPYIAAVTVLLAWGSNFFLKNWVGRR